MNADAHAAAQVAARSQDAAFGTVDRLHMTRALRLAEQGAYTTKPNPMVGCVIAQGERVLGEGWHARAGEAHAEIHALAAAGDAARGATAYVTLEPCAHHGRTGPCVEALIAAGVGRVVAAMRDPFPQVDGAGFARLQAAGIAVEHGLLEAQARQLNQGFLSRVERGRPWLRVKLAMSLDGRTALANGDSKWISGEAARRDVMRWRARAGAILTGAGTVLADDPSLTVRFDSDEGDAGAPAFVPPLRVVLDPGLATVARGKVRQGDAPTLYLHAPDAKPPRGFDAPRAAVPLRAGVAGAGGPAVGGPGMGGQGAGGLDLEAVLRHLATAHHINEVQVESGATLAGALLRAGLVDEVLLYVAPVLLGADARPLFDGLGIDDMARRLHLRTVETRRIGDDLRLLLRPQAPAA